MRGWVLIIAAAGGCFHIGKPDEDEADAGSDAVSSSVDSVTPRTDAGVPVPDASLSEVVIDGVEDTFLHLANPTFNHGATAKLCADLDDARVVLLRFNLSAIPPGATVGGAVLRIVTTGTAASDAAVDPYVVHEMLEPWVEGTLTGAPGQASWNERALGTPWISAGAGPGSRSPDVIGTFVPSAIDTEYLVPLSGDLGQRWAATPEQNRGIALLATTNDGACFYSGEAANPAQRPQLRLLVGDP